MQIHGLKTSHFSKLRFQSQSKGACSPEPWDHGIIGAFKAILSAKNIDTTNMTVDVPMVGSLVVSVPQGEKAKFEQSLKTLSVPHTTPNLDPQKSVINLPDGRFLFYHHLVSFQEK